MTGACFIDGTDIATLGALILRDGDRDFISFPARKTPKIIEWPDEDGFEISPDAPVYDAKKVTVNYYLKGDETTFQYNLNAFITLHEASGFRSISIREFDTTFQLRYTGVSSFLMNRGFTVSGEKSARISIDYVMDDPLQFIGSTGSTGSPTGPTENRPNLTKVQIYGVDLSAFGIVVQDVYSSAYRFGIKDRLVYTSQYRTGNIAYPGYTAKKAKQEITIKCTMICADRTSFMANYSALFHSLDVAMFILYLAAPQQEYGCYYSSMDGFKKRPWTDKAIASFDLKLVGFRI